MRAGLKTGINLRMENPKEMGTDRIVNLVAAYELYGEYLPLWWIMKPQPHLMLSARRANF